MTRSDRIVRVVLLLMVLCSLASSRQAISSRMWIVFHDRDAGLLKQYSPHALGITEQALHRRAKVLPPNQLIDSRDLPIPFAYLDAIRATGATIRATSRWLNAVSVEGTPPQLQACTQFSFVQTIQPVAVYKKSQPQISLSSVLQKGASGPELDYGPSLTQLSNIKVVDVHTLGINGSGVIVGMLDDGFNNYRVHPALKNIRVLADSDFVQRDGNSSRAPGEFSSQGNHGSYTLSALAGFENGKLVGPAYGASLILAKTEVDSVEIQVEEDYYVEGLEWLERLGADIVSSSLGYIDWYTYRDLDGKTATTSKAARVAAKKGVLLVTAAGNEFQFRTRNPDSTGTLIAPADADSIVAVGAASSTGVIANFSSTGPTFDGRIKPEVVAQGVSVYAANGATTSNYVFVSGTSLSTPLTAGVAALVLSAHPELTPMQIREALMQTAQRINDGTRTSTWPNNFYGSGMVNALEAVLYHGIAFSNKPQVVMNGNTMTVSISIASKIPLIADSLSLYYRPNDNVLFRRARLLATGQPNIFSVTFPVPSGSAFPQAYFSARDNAGRVRTNPYNAPTSLFFLRPDTVQIGIPPNPVPVNFILYSNYPNPFNPGTVIRFDAPEATEVELVVYNVLGQKVRTLFQGRCVQGVNRFAWNDARNDDGSIAASGVYFYQLKTSTVTLTNSMLFLR